MPPRATVETTHLHVPSPSDPGSAGLTGLLPAASTGRPLGGETGPAPSARRPRPAPAGALRLASVCSLPSNCTLNARATHRRGRSLQTRPRPPPPRPRPGPRACGWVSPLTQYPARRIWPGHGPAWPRPRPHGPHRERPQTHVRPRTARGLPSLAEGPQEALDGTLGGATVSRCRAGGRMEGWEDGRGRNRRSHLAPQTEPRARGTGRKRRRCAHLGRHMSPAAPTARSAAPHWAAAGPGLCGRLGRTWTTAAPGAGLACAGSPTLGFAGPVAAAPPRGPQVSPLPRGPPPTSALDSEANVQIFPDDVSIYN